MTRSSEGGTHRYAKHATEVRRGVALLDRKQVLVEDELKCAVPAEVWWFAHTPAEVNPRTAIRDKRDARKKANIVVSKENKKARLFAVAAKPTAKVPKSFVPRCGTLAGPDTARRSEVATSRQEAKSKQPSAHAFR